MPSILLSANAACCAMVLLLGNQFATACWVAPPGATTVKAGSTRKSVV